MQIVEILVLDFGSQYTQLIARRLRESGVYAEILPYWTKISEIKAKNPKGIILSGGPASVYEKDAYKPDSEIFDLNLPILGICYGMQFIAHFFGGAVVRAKAQEFGKANLQILDSENPLFQGVAKKSIVWMSHADKVEKLPKNFQTIANSQNTQNCAIADTNRKIYALQFHPEVVHSEFGAKILENFALKICGCKNDWNMKNFVQMEIQKLRKITEFDANLKDIAQSNGVCRCGWANDKDENAKKLYEKYHDDEWGTPLHDERKLFEMLALESFQAGLAWITILKKRENFKKAFDDFDPAKVAQYDERKILNLMSDSGIIKNRAKIQAVVHNARAFLKIQKEFGSFDKFIWGFVDNKQIVNHFQNLNQVPAHTALSDKISVELKKRGFKFVGSTSIYAFMQAIGMVNDHLSGCFKSLDSQKRGISESKESKKSYSKVLCAVSGGVDSSVVATLLYRAIGESVIPIFVDTGLLRLGEREAVEKMFKENLKVPLITIDAKKQFLGLLKGVKDPEKKRKIIGETFIKVFEQEAKKHNKNGEIKFLAQGTLYPDVIESVSVKGPSKVIKSHHNVGGLPDWMKFELIEPLRELFKDEVRALGRELGMPENMLMRHPFPGPGLAIRIMGAVNEADLEILKKADFIFIDELRKNGLYDSVWQAFCVLLNVKSVGVMGDNRTYDNTICVRAVSAADGMTASFSHLPHEFLESVSNRIINEVQGVNRVVYDITSKPPGTIEWE